MNTMKKMNMMMIFTTIASALLLAASCEKNVSVHVDSESESIRIATYNIRSNGGSDTQDWDTRLASLDSLFQRYDFDIIGSQEPFQRQIDDLMDLHGDVYDYVTFRTGSGGSPVTSHHNPVFWKKDRFSLLDSGMFWFSETPDVQFSISWGASQPRNCIWVKLHDEESNQDFYVFNSHFDHQSTPAKAQSASLLLARVDSIAGDDLAICTGDFNTNQTTQIFANLSTSGVLVDTHTIADSIVNDDYRTSHGYTVIPPAPGSYRIDHILISESFSGSISLWKCAVDNFGGNWASDHYPVFIDLGLN